MIGALEFPCYKKIVSTDLFSYCYESSNFNFSAGKITNCQHIKSVVDSLITVKDVHRNIYNAWEPASLI